MEFLSSYLGKDYDLTNKNVLELGPGADLGVGLYLLYRGANAYNSIDVNNLVATVPSTFYEKLFERLNELKLNATDDMDSLLEGLRQQLEKTRKGKNDRLNYVCRNDFSLREFNKGSIDLVVSQAAFEHFDDVESTFRQLSDIVRPGAHLVAEIDLKTHTRWIRDRDPLNIYRYGRFYDFIQFRGAPNRLRPYQYKKYLEDCGWENVKIRPRIQLRKEYVNAIITGMNEKYRDEMNQMEYLSIIVCATKNRVD